ncbi:hypothetical protein EKG83_29020 [Saccharothrix syringae]|uniref:Uncharacterized protein n=1 Tax=Saccharothrix syringae TaxID=103733 RepID=A0A5Q0H577_SACSY|nr:hypothetical protein [Saccharothrix syringae]QFZ20892.1 hypothetical protein EKG83_29020 [Saccharothrix syringae]
MNTRPEIRPGRSTENRCPGSTGNRSTSCGGRWQEFKRHGQLTGVGSAGVPTCGVRTSLGSGSATWSNHARIRNATSPGRVGVMGWRHR